MKRGACLSDLLKPLDQCGSQVILTNVLQVADVLDWILAQTGTADICQTTFSISEEFLRRLFHFKHAGLIRSASLLIDHKATNKTLKLWVFMSQLYDKVFMTDNHSKILLVKSLDGKKISVVTSQNLTRGDRFESTFISSDPDIFDNLKNNFDFIAENLSVPLDELLGRYSQEN